MRIWGVELVKLLKIALGLQLWIVICLGMVQSIRSEFLRIMGPGFLIYFLGLRVSLN